MKTVTKNAILVLSLAGLFFVPVMGFNFASYQQADKSQVLGSTAIIPSRDSVKVIGQVDLTLHLNTDRQQKFYNVLPEKYLDSDYDVIVVAPQKIKDAGVSFELINNGLSADLEVTLKNEVRVSSFDIALLIVN